MHSGLILILWLAAVASIQLLSLPALAVAVPLCLLAALVFARVRLLRLLRRVRVLLIAIAILFAWFTPGEAFFHDWPRLGPTREGLAFAVLHAARLIAVVCAVAVLLERLSLQRLVAGLHALARPLRLIGVPPERLALRLLLVLRYVEASPRDQGRLQWRDWLMPENGEDAGEVGAREVVVLNRERLGVFDVSVALGASLGLLWWSLG
jgi:energy-coupling factor transporter transmembrane protein EcfT